MSFFFSLPQKFSQLFLPFLLSYNTIKKNSHLSLFTILSTKSTKIRNSLYSPRIRPRILLVETIGKNLAVPGSRRDVLFTRACDVIPRSVQAPKQKGTRKNGSTGSRDRSSPGPERCSQYTPTCSDRRGTERRFGFPAGRRRTRAADEEEEEERRESRGG